MLIENIKIYKIDNQDVDQLQQISRKTFFETFANQNTKEDIDNYLQNNLSKTVLENELSNPDSEFYFAENNNEIIGYLKINIDQAQTENKLENALEIERIYVLQEFHGKKIGHYMIEKVLEIAKNKKMNWIWLGVWEENYKAIAFYNKYGFQVFDKHIFKLGNDIQTDLLMQLKLN